jgi:hypothetical protein
LFQNVQHSWFGLGTLQVYGVDYEREEYDGFAATERLERPPGDWQQMITRLTKSGCLLRRVHVVVEPLTDDLR